jgi:hypothetical protein
MMELLPCIVFYKVITATDISTLHKDAITTTKMNNAVLSVLTYFEIFRYPLTMAEIQHYLSAKISLEHLSNCLSQLVQMGIVYQIDTYYQTLPNVEWVADRQEKNARAALFLPKAYSMGRFIGQFPFVKAVMVSGSLSKDCMSEDGDIDFFLVTRPRRLWLARTILVMYKKIFLFNSHKYFCVNYFIDTNHLEIEEKNLFTATECATLLPVYNADMYQSFMEANTWVQRDYYPNIPLRNTDSLATQEDPVLKKGLEYLFGGFLGQYLDRFSMRLTVGFWKRKFKHFTAKHFDIALKSRKYVSKHHPLGFQERVMNKYGELMRGRGF